MTPLSITYVQGAFPPSTHYGGPAISGYQLCRALVGHGVNVRVLAIAANGDDDLDVPRDCWTEYRGVPVYYGARVGRTLIAPRMYVGAGDALNCDVLHASGGFSATFPIMTARAMARGIPVVMSPRGSFIEAALKTSSAKKRLYNRVMGPLYSRIHAFHATSQVEAHAIRALVRDATVQVLPNGVLVPAALNAPLPSTPTQPFLLFLGRLDPYKRVDAIVRAFARAEPRASLVVAGAGSNSYRQELEALAGRLGVGDRVVFTGQVSGENKTSLLQHADGLVLASHSENFGMCVAEALAHATPCNVTRTAPWEGLETHRAGFWIDHDDDALSSAMKRLLDDNVDRAAMGQRGRAWMQAELTWDRIAARMIELYRLVLQNQARAPRASTRSELEC